MTFHQVAAKMKGRSTKPIIFLSIFASIGMGLGFALGNYVYLILALNNLFGLSLRLCSLGIYLFVLVILWLVVEPEKIKPVAYILTCFIFGTGKFKFNIFFLLIKISLDFDVLQLRKVFGRKKSQRTNIC